MEIELRAKIQDVDSLRERLQSLQAQYISRREITDYYFGEIGLYKKINHSFWIRIRQDGEKYELAYKGPTETDGIYDEYEITLPNLEIGVTICQKMGLDNPITIHKTRETYKIGDIKVLIDDFHEKGIFVELERISNDENKDQLIKLCEQLGIPPEDIFHKGYITNFLAEEGSPFSEWIKN